MPSTLSNSGSKPSKSRSKPYGDTSRRQTQATNHRGPPPSGNSDPLSPPLVLGQDSMLDLARECVQKRFPNFVPRNSSDIISLAGTIYEGPMYQESICVYLDKMHEDHIPFLMEKHNCTEEEAIMHLSAGVDSTIGRMAATDTVGAKPRPGQKTWLRVMPAWPEYSVRLWLSSRDVKLFGMDFVLSSTGAPINLSHRFKLHTTAWICGPDGTMELKPFKFEHPPGTHPGYYPPPGPPAPGTELYMLGAEQTIFIQDRLQLNLHEVAELDLAEDVEPLVTLLRFDVPKHPGAKGRWQLPSGSKFDELHWSLDE